MLYPTPSVPSVVPSVQGTSNGQANNDFITASGLFQDPLAESASGDQGPQPASVNREGLASTAGNPSTDTGLQSDAMQGSTVSDAGAFVLAECALEKHCWGQNPVVTAKLQLNGQDRFSEREGTYFDLVQPYQHHTRNPTQVATSTPSLFAPKNTNHPAHATCPESITLLFNLLSALTPLVEPKPPKSAFTPLTTMSSVS